MDTWANSIFQGFGSTLNIFLYRTGQSTNRSVLDSFGNRFYGSKISWAGNRKTSFNNIYAKVFKHQCQFNFFLSVQLAAGHLLSIAQGGVKNENLFVRHRKRINNANR